MLGRLRRLEPEKTTAQLTERRRCSEDPAYFIRRYCYILNATERAWVRFELWPAQETTLRTILDERLLVVLKARQLGLSWLVLCYLLWMMLFRSVATVLIFSKRDEEAIELLDNRLKGVYDRLPAWLQDTAVWMDTKHDWLLANGSSAKAFPTTGGRSYTGSVVLVDEADFVQDLDGLLNAVKPTIDAGGQLIMISTVDKSQPNSPFKRIYRGARQRLTEWRSVFLPWHARPGRDAAWYAAQKADILQRTTALDDLHQEYPETDTEALAPRTLDKRIPAMWIEACFEELDPLIDENAPALPGLTIYRSPQQDRLYVIGGDPAEGNPTSDDSALTVLDVASGEECAVLAGKFQPSVLAGYADQLGRYYNKAGLMVERNNHGHAVLLWLDEHSKLKILKGHDDKLGWMSSSLGKTLLYNEMADYFRDNALAEAKVLHSFLTYSQLASIEGSTLRAPEGEYDDRADSYALAEVGRAAMMADTSNLQVMRGAAALYGSRARADASASGSGRRGGPDQQGRRYGSRR